MTDVTFPLQSDADQRAIAALRRKNAVWRRILKDPPAAAAASSAAEVEGMPPPDALLDENEVELDE